jgi:predicted O-methyltransferase YrrM
MSASTRSSDVVRAVADIPGWLEDEDVLKLYELAASTDGPILEIGTWRGKSGAALALGARDGGRGAAIVSVDINEERLGQARAELAARELGSGVTLVRGTAAALFAAAPDLAPTLVFVDGDHTRRGVERDLAVLERHVPSGAELLFHDYANTRNEYDVRRTVDESWVERDCDFAGVFGMCGLFARRRGGPDATGAPLLVNAVRYDAPLLRWKQRVPAGLREQAFRLLRSRKR